MSTPRWTRPLPRAAAPGVAVVARALHGLGLELDVDTPAPAPAAPAGGQPEGGRRGGVDLARHAEALGPLERHDGARRAGAEHAVGATRHGDAGPDQGVLQGDDAGAALVVGGEPGGRRGRRPAPPGALRRGGRRRAGQSEQAGGGLVDDAGAGMPLLRWARIRRSGSCAEDPVGAAAQRPAHLHAAPAGGRRRPGRGCRGASPMVDVAGPLGAARPGPGRRRAQGSRVAASTAPVTREALGLLERPAAAPLGAHAEDAVGTAGHGDRRRRSSACCSCFTR